MFCSDDLSLLGTLATTLALALANVGLTQKIVSDRLLARDIDQARQVQAALIPPPDPRGYVAGRVIPARQLSGDFFDHLQVGHRIAFCQGDVAGKGIAAALLMARALALFRQLARRALDCVSIVTAINDELNRDPHDAAQNLGFVSFVAGWFDPETGKVSIINCGHGPALLCQPGAVPLELPADTLPLGIVSLDKADLAAVCFDLGEGCLYLATDGITEARAKGRELGGLALPPWFSVCRAAALRKSCVR